MLKIFFIQTIFFFTVCSSAFAEWTSVSTNHHGTYFVDLSSIKEENGYRYYWDLGNLNSPIGGSILSIKSYNQGDCNSFLRKSLRNSFHKNPMGEGNGEVDIVKNKKWVAPPKNSSAEEILKLVCEYKP
jgi:hypothetical protein